MHKKILSLPERILFVTAISFIISLILFAVGSHVAHAANPHVANASGTRVSGEISGNAIWTKEGSPYLLTGEVDVLSGATLTIGSGTIVHPDPSVSMASIIVNDGGTISIDGAKDDRAIIGDINNISILGPGATLRMRYADMRTQGALYFLRSYGDIASSTFASSTGAAIYSWGGHVDVVDSILEKNMIGIYAIDFPGSPTSVSIHGSAIAKNATYAVYNRTPTVIQAEDNWWGDPAGPLAVSSSSIYGDVSYDPWLDHDPTLLAQAEACCSNILFLPGIEGSWLYRDENGLLGSGIGPGMSTNTLWAPNSNNDARKLFLNPDGTSINPSIYSGGPISSVFGLYDVYGKFMSFLDGLVKKGTVNEWGSFGYDWRRPIADVVLGPEKKATTTVSLIQTVSDLASRSKTGKVTLIAHSTGGLVAKYLTKTLADIGKSDLIDSVISVAVPYLGTPQAISSILHGDNGEIVHGLILKQSVARQLGQNMASVYSLLPSSRYFSRVAGPVITFSSTTPASIGSGSYSTSIQSFADQSSFVTDALATRAAPDPSDLSGPIRGSASLMAQAGSLHDMLDAFSWPEAIRCWAIIGWNVLTAKTVSYADKRATVETNMGDGTVMAKSAAYDDGTAVSADLKRLSQDERADMNHVTILEASSTQASIAMMVTHASSSEPSSSTPPFSLPAGMSWGEPDYGSESTYLVFSTHSPVTLDVYDDRGNHTGFIPKPPQADTEDDIFAFYENNIPGSDFSTMANSDADQDSYIYVPDDGRRYDVSIKGTGVGPFTFDITRERGGDALEKVSYADLPATPLLSATATIQIDPLGASATSSLPLSAPSLSIDNEGDGVVDARIAPDAPADPIAFLESLRKVVLFLDGSSQKGKAILRRIDHLEDMARAGKISRLHDTAVRFASHLDHRSIKGLSDADRLLIANLIDDFLSRLEQASA